MLRAILIAAFLTPAIMAAEIQIMPWPAKLSPGNGALQVDTGFSISTSSYSDTRLEAAIARLTNRLSRVTGIQLSALKPQRATLTISCRHAAPATPTLGEDESYTLDVEPNGARLEAETTTGALRGMETLAQLVRPGVSGYEIPSIQIEDRPRFAWRGLMLDVSRHWMPVDVIERNLDAMAAVKLNVFHWHLSDDQGFRVESKRFPKLQQFGSDGLFYTQDDIRHVIAYAGDRGIRVVPEFDIPGHTSSWLAAMPELGSAPGPYKIERKWGVFEPTLDPSREEVYTFLDAFIGEMAALFPDPCFHIGGDEVEGTAWTQSPGIQAFAREHGLKTNQDLLAYFTVRVEKIVKKHGKTMIGWDEILSPEIDSAAIIQSWRGQESLAQAAKKGNRGILSYGYYLDYLKPASYHYANDPLSGAAHDLSPADSERILGGEACMWSEYVSAVTIDSRLWPRTAAIAERLWSPASVKDIDSMYQRLDAVSGTLEWVGAKHRSNTVAILNEMAGGVPAEPLRVLADAVEALGIVGRRDEHHYTSGAPLNRLVDAARPESESVRTLERCSEEIANNPTAKAALNSALTQWRDNHTLLLPLARNNALVEDALPFSEELSTLGTIGLQALKYIESGQAPSENWLTAQRQVVTEIGKPKKELVIAAAGPVMILLDAASHAATK
jgi:hexosaminidase